MGWQPGSALLFLASLLLLLFLSSMLLKASRREHASQLFKILRTLLKQCYFPGKETEETYVMVIFSAVCGSEHTSVQWAWR